RTNRPGDRDSVAVPAAASVHRASVQTRGAADAVQRAAEGFVGERLRAAVVEQHDMQFGSFTRSVEMRTVRGYRLSRGGARQQPKKRVEVRQERHELHH